MTARNLSRRTDPRTSSAAAERHVATGANDSQKARVLAALRDHPGSTSAELAQRMGVDRYMVARRLPDLLRDGAVERGPERECLAHGGEAVTWVPALRPHEKATAQLRLFGGTK